MANKDYYKLQIVTSLITNNEVTHKSLYDADKPTMPPSINHIYLSPCNKAKTVK